MQLLRSLHYLTCSNANEHNDNYSDYYNSYYDHAIY